MKQENRDNSKGFQNEIRDSKTVYIADTIIINNGDESLKKVNSSVLFNPATTKALETEENQPKQKAENRELQSIQQETKTFPNYLVEEEKLDYSRLEKYLNCSHPNWAKADRETYELLLKSLGLSVKVQLVSYNTLLIKNFPNKVLNEIDKIWKQYSQNKFGYSIQRDIYLKYTTENKIDNNQISLENWNKFCRDIGWININNKFVPVEKLYNNLKSQNCKNLVGCLPSYRIFTKDENDCYKSKPYFRKFLLQFES